MPSVAHEGAPAHFTREQLSHELASEFASGAGNADQLIDAAQMQYSQELAAAQLLRAEPERTKDVSKADLAKAAELDEHDLLSHSVHGGYVIYQFGTPDGRVHKDALLIDDAGKLSLPDRPDTPQRQALRAAVKARSQVKEAESEAQRIVADARRKAAEIVAEAAAKARGEQEDAAVQAQKDADADEGTSEPVVSDQVAGGRAPASKTAGARAERASGGGKKDR